MTMTAAPCPGICNRDWRKAEQDRVKAEDLEARLAEIQERAPRPVGAHGLLAKAGEPVWCESCAQRIARSLLGLPDAFVQLELDKLHGTTAGGEHVSGSKSPASPSPAADEQDDLVRFLAGWEDVIRDLRELTLRPARKPVTPSRPLDRCSWPRPLRRVLPRSVALLGPTQQTATVMGCVKFLTAHLEWALAHEDIGKELGQELLREESRLRRRTRLDEQRSRKPVPCPRCELRTLVHEGGAAYVGCENPDCGRLLKMDEYDELAAIWAREAKSSRRVPA